MRRSLVVATPSGEMRLADALGRRLLKDFFGRPSRAGLLPHKVSHWMTAEIGARKGKSLISRRGERRLFVSKYRIHPPDAIPLLLEVTTGAPSDSIRLHSSLTFREGEVLYWMASSKTTRDIAQILDISPRTVDKHTQRVLQKLGVENRTAAANVYAAG